MRVSERAHDKGYEALDELPKLFHCGIACEPAASFEDAAGTGRLSSIPSL
jgi:hypothetical protein